MHKNKALGNERGECERHVDTTVSALFHLLLRCHRHQTTHNCVLEGICPQTIILNVL